MKLSRVAISYNKDYIFQTALDFFKSEIIEYANELTKPLSKVELFEFYDKYISVPIEDSIEESNNERKDFLEAISIMLWAIYGQWVKLVVDRDCNINCTDTIERYMVITNFLSNLSCEEGVSILAKVISESRHNDSGE